MTRTPPYLATLVALTALTVLTLNMFLPALPTMQAEFGVSEAVMGFAISGYMGAAAILQLVLGPLSDRIGRRPVILGVLSVYVVASAVCLVAGSVTLFLAARIVQAVAVGGAVLSSAMVRDMFDQRAAASKLATIASAMAIAPMLAPMLGGALDAAFGWRAIFLAYTGIGAALLVWVWRDVGETHAATTKGRVGGYRALLTAPLFWAYTLVFGFGLGVFFIFITGAPFVAAEVFGLSSDLIGIGIGSITAGFMLGAALSAWAVTRVGTLPLILAGRILPLVTLPMGYAAFTLGAEGPLWLFGVTITAGFGNGMSLANANAGALSVRPELAGTAAGVAGAASLALGAALATTATAVLTAEASPERLLLLMIGAATLALLAALAAARWQR